MRRLPLLHPSFPLLASLGTLRYTSEFRAQAETIIIVTSDFEDVNLIVVSAQPCWKRSILIRRIPFISEYESLKTPHREVGSVTVHS